MGAAAVFETAAETPPTVDKQSVIVFRPKKFFIGCASMAEANWPRNRWQMRCWSRRTQEIDHEALARMLAAVLKSVVAVEARPAAISAIARSTIPSRSIVAMPGGARAMPLR